MASTRLGGTLRFATLAILAGLAASALADAFSIEGTLIPLAPLRFDGVVRAVAVPGTGLVATVRPPDAHTTWQANDEPASVSILHVRWKTSTADPTRILPESGGADAIGFQVSTERFDVLSPALQTTPQGDQIWALTPDSTHDLRVALDPNGPCFVSTGPARPIRISHDPEQLYPYDLWTGARDAAVRTECRDATAVATGPATLTVFGATVRITGTQPDHRGTIERTVRADLARSQDDPSPNILHHELTVLQVMMHGDATRTLPHGELAMQTPALGLRGRLLLPDSVGTITWANRTFVNPGPTLSPSGEFTLTSASSNRIIIRGDSTNKAALLAVGFGSAAAVATEAARRFAFGLYTRMVRGRVLEHPRRRMIADAVTVHPGITVAGLAALLRISRQTAAFHIAVLRREGIVTPRRFGGAVAVFPIGRLTPIEEARSFYVRKPSHRAALELVEQNPGIGQDALGDRLHLSQPQVSKILRALAKAGLIVAARDGPIVRYGPRTDGP